MSKNYGPVIFSDHSETIEQTKLGRNFLVERCFYCGEEVELVEKTVIYGEKWYHNFCWMLINRKDLEKITQIHETEVCQT